MMNQIILVGRTYKIDTTCDNNKKKTTMTLAVTRPYKNSDGVYDTDFIDITLWDNIAENTVARVGIGDVVGVKGRIQTTSYTNEDNGYTTKKMEIVAEKVTFLTSQRANES